MRLGARLVGVCSLLTGVILAFGLLLHTYQ
jgi:hypothetical protein